MLYSVLHLVSRSKWMAQPGSLRVKLLFYTLEGNQEAQGLEIRVITTESRNSNPNER